MSKGFMGRNRWGEKLELHLVALFKSLGFHSVWCEFDKTRDFWEEVERNTVDGDGYITLDSGDIIKWDAKRTMKVSVKSAEKFEGDYFILTDDMRKDVHNIDPKNLYVITNEEMKRYYEESMANDQLITMPSNNLGFIVNIDCIEYVTIDKFVNDIL